jgi:hypothetical protein
MLVCLAISFVIKEFDDHIHRTSNCSEDIKTIRWRFNIAFYILAILAAALGFVFILFGSYEPIRRRATYQMFCLPTGSCMAAALLTLTTSRTMNKTHNMPMPIEIKSGTAIIEMETSLHRIRSGKWFKSLRKLKFTSVLKPPENGFSTPDQLIKQLSSPDVEHT